MSRAVFTFVAIFVALNLVAVPWAQTQVYRLSGIDYVFPASQGNADDALTAADGAGTLAWSPVSAATTWPEGAIVLSPTGSCPSGWTEYTTARGRSIVGLVSGGTNGNTPGTALTDLENRSTGQHTHAVTDPGHTHAQVAHSHSTIDPGHAHAGILAAAGTLPGGGSLFNAGENGLTATTNDPTGAVSVANATAVNQSALTGATLANAGSVASTNAPYIQIVFCQTPEVP